MLWCLGVKTDALVVLDDNTYTNKTWAEVSGISVGEIHVMEVEFLSNMRYNLLASAEQWAKWLAKVGKFADYFEAASKVPLAPSPIRNNYPTAYLPSPVPVGMPSQPPMLHPVSNGVIDQSTYSSSQQHYPPTQLFPQTCNMSRKRSFDDIRNESAPKRPATATTRPAPTALSSYPAMQSQILPRLPVPDLIVPQSQNVSHPSFQQSLPPLPAANGGHLNQLSTTAPNWPTHLASQSQMSLPPLSGTNTGYSLPGSNHGTPSRRNSPSRVAALRSMNSSPLAPGYSHSSYDNNSPSAFYESRQLSDPFLRPSTLLHSQPTSNYDHFQPPPVDHMHYQQIGKRNDYRTGIVPEYRGAGGMAQIPYWQPISASGYRA